MSTPTPSALRSALARPLIGIALAASMVVGGVPLATPSVAQDADSLSAYVPDDSLVFVELELDPESEQAVLAHELIDRANLSALFPESDQEMIDESVAMVEETIDGDAALFVSPAIADSLAVEELAEEASSLADDPLGTADDLPTGWTVVLRPADPQAVYDMIVESFSGSGGLTQSDITGTPAASGFYEGYTIESVPGTVEGPGTAVALVDDVVVVATVPEDIHPVIDVVTGAVDPLGENDTYNEVRSRFPEQLLASGFLNGPAIGLILASTDDVAIADISADMLASLVAYQGFAVYAEEAGFRMDTVAVPAPGTDLPVPAAFSGTLTDLVPADAMVFAGGSNLGDNPGLNALALAVASDLAGVSPDDLATPVDLEGMADQVFADAEATLGFNLKTDVLDQLTGEWAFAGTTDLTTGAALFVSEVEDPAVVSDVVAEVTAMFTAESDETVVISSRTVGDAEVTVVEMEGEPEALTIEFGVVDGKLAIGLNGWLDNVATPPADPIAGAPRYEEAIGYLPSNVTGVVYVDLSAVLPMVADAITSFTMLEIEDADPSCAEYATQEDAQAAYDEDTFENYLLDLDWDGTACEDFFAPATPVAAEPAATTNVEALASVTWAEDGVTGSSTIVVIGE